MSTFPTPRSRRPVFRILESNAYFVVRHDPERRLVLVTRHPLPYPSIEALHATFDRMLASYGALSRADHRILIDARAAPARNDEAFEEAMAVRRPEALRGFSQIAMLIRTVAGKLQIGRHAHADGLTVFIGADVAEMGAELDVMLDEALLAAPG